MSRILEEPQSGSDLRGIAAYLAAGFNVLDPSEQRYFVRRLERYIPGVEWGYVLKPQIYENARLTRKIRGFGGDGPELVPAVDADQFVRLLSNVSSAFNHRHLLELDGGAAVELEEMSQDAEKRRIMFWCLRIFVELRTRMMTLAP
ncbi:MAG TPA: hypothetical protein VGK01_25265, partial [Candidatus Angelobacter sp.]